MSDGLKVCLIFIGLALCLLAVVALFYINAADDLEDWLVFPEDGDVSEGQ